MEFSNTQLSALAEYFLPTLNFISNGLISHPYSAIYLGDRVNASNKSNSTNSNSSYEANIECISILDLYTDIMEFHSNVLPELQNILSEISKADIDDIDELNDELDSICEDYIAMVNDVWEVNLEPNHEYFRLILVGLAKAPLEHLLKIFQQVIQGALDPWAVFDNPESPNIDFTIPSNCIEDSEAFAIWQAHNHKFTN